MAEQVPIQASAGTDATIIASMAPKGAVLTNEPLLGEPEKAPPAEPEKPAFFPANPAFPEELAKNKPVKELSKEGSGGSGSGVFRTISGVISDLRGKHQDKKRVSQVAQAKTTCAAAFPDCLKLML